jgi:hypothetical protein
MHGDRAVLKELSLAVIASENALTETNLIFEVVIYNASTETVGIPEHSKDIFPGLLRITTKANVMELDVHGNPNCYCNSHPTNGDSRWSDGPTYWSLLKPNATRKYTFDVYASVCAPLIPQIKKLLSQNEIKLSCNIFVATLDASTTNDMRKLESSVILKKKTNSTVKQKIDY